MGFLMDILCFRPKTIPKNSAEKTCFLQFPALFCQWFFSADTELMSARIESPR